MAIVSRNQMPSSDHLAHSSLLALDERRKARETRGTIGSGEKANVPRKVFAKFFFGHIHQTIVLASKFGSSLFARDLDQL
jgi:hypothetical protein